MFKAQLLSDVEDLLNRCLRLHDGGTTSDALRDPFKDCPPETDLGPEDSVSQVASCQSALSTTSSKLLARRLILIAGRRNFELFTPVIWLGRRRMPQLVLVVLVVLLLRLTPRPGYELGKQSSKLKKITLLFLKAAHRRRFRGDLKINFAQVVLSHLVSLKLWTLVRLT